MTGRPPRRGDDDASSPAASRPRESDEPAQVDGGQRRQSAAARRTGAGQVLALLALGWLAAMLWSTREAITSAAAGVTAISLSAFALPGVISAALVAGAAVALAGGNLLARRYGDRATLRFAGAIGGRHAGRARGARWPST